MNFFENYAIVAMESDNVTFYACKIIKVTSGFNLKKRIFFARWRQHPQNSWNIFQIQITPLFRRPQGPQGCLEKQNHPLSLNLVVWRAKIWPKTKKLQNNRLKTIILDILKLGMFKSKIPTQKSYSERNTSSHNGKNSRP